MEGAVMVLTGIPLVRPAPCPETGIALACLSAIAVKIGLYLQRLVTGAYSIAIHTDVADMERTYLGYSTEQLRLGTTLVRAASF